MKNNNVEFVTTDETLNKIRELADLNRTTISNVLGTSLKAWYEANKERLNNNENSLKLIMCNTRLDEETEKIYKLFVNDYMKILLDNLNEN